MKAREKRAPEFVCIAVRKVEPVGGAMVRVYFAMERNGAWDDQFTVLMPMAAIPAATGFVAGSVREIAAEMATATVVNHLTH
jgi:hypothetical protein